MAGTGEMLKDMLPYGGAVNIRGENILLLF